MKNEGADLNCHTSDFSYISIQPGWILRFVLLLSLACLIMTIKWSIDSPWLGLNLHPDPSGIRVLSVTQGGPSDRLLKPGDVLVSLRTTRGDVFSLSSESLLTGPDIHPTFDGYNHFFHIQKSLFDAVTSGPIKFVLLDGRTITITANRQRPLNSLQWTFWAIDISGFIVFVVGVGVWIFRPRMTATRLIALSGVGYLLTSTTLAVYGPREWLLQPDLFQWLASFDYLGELLYGYSLMAIFWYYPRPLGRFPVATLFIMAAFFMWLNNMIFQLIEWPLHTFHFQFFPFFIAGAWFAYRQWVLSEHHPDERASLKWFLRITMMAIGLVLSLYFLPQLFGRKRIIQYWASEFLVVWPYIGVILGVLRFRLFDLDRWWFMVWAWVLGGLFVISVDMGFVYYTNLYSIGALTLSLVLVGWLYFPIRQFAWGRLVRSPSESVETYLPIILETFFSDTDLGTLGASWQNLLKKVFDPLVVNSADNLTSEVELNDSGLRMVVPALDEYGGVTLSGRSQGTRLFDKSDVHLATLLLSLAKKVVSQRYAQEHGATMERERIARDLHDDVAPQLLTLAHSATTPKNAERARSAMQTLRESIYALSSADNMPLDTVLAELHLETIERIEAANVALCWHSPDSINDANFSTRQRLNFARVLREGISNALKHASPSLIEITLECGNRKLSMQLTHDGDVSSPESWVHGKGLTNMRMRTEELGGDISWSFDTDTMSYLTLNLTIPLVL